jgi:hypothetical protein
MIAVFAAPIRRYAAASTPLIARADMGTRCYRLDILDTGLGGVWIALADETGALIGWSPAAAWRDQR